MRFNVGHLNVKLAFFIELYLTLQIDFAARCFFRFLTMTCLLNNFAHPCSIILIAAKRQVNAHVAETRTAVNCSCWNFLDWLINARLAHYPYGFENCARFCFCFELFSFFRS